jgi:hypothetical protein
MRFFLVVLAITFYTSFLYAEESSFKFTFGSNLANIPLEFNKISKNIKKSPGIKINSWILSPNFLSFAGTKKILNFSENRESKEKESLYIRFNFKF